jgi:predicted  nucleic acid-binding Zn ribbon protein
MNFKSTLHYFFAVVPRVCVFKISSYLVSCPNPASVLCYHQLWTLAHCPLQMATWQCRKQSTYLDKSSAYHHYDTYDLLQSLSNKCSYKSKVRHAAGRPMAGSIKTFYPSIQVEPECMCHLKWWRCRAGGWLYWLILDELPFIYHLRCLTCMLIVRVQYIFRCTLHSTLHNRIQPAVYIVCWEQGGGSCRHHVSDNVKWHIW